MFSAWPVSDFGNLDSKLAPKKASFRRIPTVAICTLAALGARDLTHHADAAQPEISDPKEAGDFVVPVATEEAAPIKSTASPEAPAVQEFAHLPDGHSELHSHQGQPTRGIVGAGSVVVPTVGTSQGAAKPHDPESEFTSNGRKEKEVRTSSASEGKGKFSPDLDSSDRPMLETRPDKPLVQQPAPHLAAETMPVSVQSYRTQDLQAVASTREIPTPVKSAIAPRAPQQASNTSQRNLVSFHAEPLRSAQHDIRLAKGELLTLSDINPHQTGASVLAAEPAAIPSQEEIQKLQNQLQGVPAKVEVEDVLQGSPALTIVNPTGFGLDNNTGFISATYQARTRYSNKSDGAIGLGIGLGDARKSVGVELSYAIASFGSNRAFGSGGFNVKVHHQLSEDLAVAAGWNGFLNLGGANDFEHSVYGVVTKIFRTRDDINLPLSRVAVTAGLGNGQFRSEGAVARGVGGVNAFGSVAVRVARPVSLIAEWTGEDLALGLSIVPFKNLNLVITPAVRDIIGAGNGPRFVLGAGFAFKF